MACVLAQTMKVVESWTAVAGQAKKRICISFSCPETESCRYVAGLNLM